jgi:hypothetical protein
LDRPSRWDRGRTTSLRHWEFGDPADAVGRALDGLRKWARTDGVHTTALAFDPLGWQLLHFTLWEQAVQEETPDAVRYEVLHLSTPEHSGVTGIK